LPQFKCIYNEKMLMTWWYARLQWWQSQIQLVCIMIVNIWVGMDQISTNANITSNMYESYLETCHSWSSNFICQQNNYVLINLLIKIVSRPFFRVFASYMDTKTYHNVIIFITTKKINNLGTIGKGLVIEMFN